MLFRLVSHKFGELAGHSSVPTQITEKERIHPPEEGFFVTSICRHIGPGIPDTPYAKLILFEFGESDERTALACRIQLLIAFPYSINTECRTKSIAEHGRK